MIDHDNLEEFADPVDYYREDSSDTGVAFYAALARETVAELAHVHRAHYTEREPGRSPGPLLQDERLPTH